ncbi:CvpA family protein [Desulfolutivibrio sulfoxidireducens]|uniref:CvpA family protein n=1 Tax=Desulfolutivibrio sulfoxidireducens TaxID=2773299 RepID=UPI00159E43A8|nr:CvpA family protein [Desulfolutivibrio sulfoxidireducens]QLA15248.1 colicin V production protein [Desulfolutivibrio sulfoxidireducens]QLA18816.1 colicin V production protein [Desulfolutivibrio sulfoxidireducens]
MNIADLVLLLAWGFFFLRGYMRGLVKEVGSLAALIVGFYAAANYHQEVTPYLSGHISGNYAQIAAYLLVFTASLLAVWFLVLGLSKLVSITMTQWADKLFGGAFGLAKGVLLAAVVFFFMTTLGHRPDFLKSSRLAPFVEKAGDLVSGYVPPDIKSKLQTAAEEVPKAMEAAKTPAATKIPAAVKKQNQTPPKKP